MILINSNEIESYADLLQYIDQEVKSQVTVKKKTVKIKLNSIWFFKLAKYIICVLKYEEPNLKMPKEGDTYYKVKINGYKTTIIKK